MENNQIILNLTDEVKVELSADTPDMQTLIDDIVKYRNVIKPDNISVEIPEGSTFDKDGFEIMIRNVIREYLETLELEDIYFNKAQSKV